MDRKAFASVNGKLVIDNALTGAKILYAMRLFRDAVKLAHHLIEENLEWGEIERRVTSFIGNAHYAHSAYQKAKLWSNQKKLKLRKKFLFSVGNSNEKGNRNIRLIHSDDHFTVRIKIPHADGKHEWVECKAFFGEKYVPLLKEVSEGKISYGVETDGECIHVYVPLDVYSRFKAKRVVKENASHIASFDINSDRINMVIIDKNGNILDSKNEHFQEVTQHGFPKEKARDIRLKALSALIDYACCHNVRHFVFEKIGKIKRKKSANKNANRKATKFPKRQIIQHAKTMIARREGEFHEINPAFSSQDAEIIAKTLRLDRHTASAYIIGFRYVCSLRNESMSMKTVTVS